MLNNLNIVFIHNSALFLVPYLKCKCDIDHVKHSIKKVSFLMPNLFYRMYKKHFDGFDLKLTIHFAQAC